MTFRLTSQPLRPAWLRALVFLTALTLLSMAAWLTLGAATSAPDDTVADRVFGQPDFSSGLCNQGSAIPPSPPPSPSASTLCLPGSVVADGAGNLYVADISNNRVLEYDSPHATDAIADRVFGQSGNFTTSSCNLGGAGNLCLGAGGKGGGGGGGGPAVVAVDEPGNVYIADRVNSRVLEYDNPLGTDTVADRVFGQGGDFATFACNNGGISAASLCAAAGVTLDSTGNLYVADTGNSRVLVYNTPLTSDTVADRVLGQSDFTANGCNQGSTDPPPSASASTLCRPNGLAVDRNGNVYIADTITDGVDFGGRVLEFDNPLGTDTVADRVFGQPDFTSFICASPSGSSLCVPGGLAVDAAGDLYVADSGNSRVLEYNSPLTTDTVADRVFGQGGSFTSNACNLGGTSASSLCSPNGVGAGASAVYIADSGNNRVLEYDAALIGEWEVTFTFESGPLAGRTFVCPFTIKTVGSPTTASAGLAALAEPGPLPASVGGEMTCSDFGDGIVVGTWDAQTAILEIQAIFRDIILTVTGLVSRGGGGGGGSFEGAVSASDGSVGGCAGFRKRPPTPTPTPKPLEARFDWSMPKRFGRDDNADGLIDYFDSPAEVQPSSWEVDFNACASTSDAGIVSYQWSIDGEPVFERSVCELFWFFPEERTYQVTLAIVDALGRSASVAHEVAVQDWLIVSIGDSVASGEGNPDKSGTLGIGETWEDRLCHRSAFAGPAQSALSIEQADPRTSVTFVHVACSGATVDEGLLGYYTGIEPEENTVTFLDPQILQVMQLTGNREVDALLISVGANDIGFSKIVDQCVKKTACYLFDNPARKFQRDLSKLPGRYDRLDACISPDADPCVVVRVDPVLGQVSEVIQPLNVPSNRVFITEYFDPTRDDFGQYCSAILDVKIKGIPVLGVTQDELKWAAEVVITGLNSQVSAAAAIHGWNYVSGISDAFFTHGYCANDHWIVQADESLNHQGNEKGTLHPNGKGHGWYGARIAEELSLSFSKRKNIQ